MPASVPVGIRIGVLNDTADLLDAEGPDAGDVTGWLEREIGRTREAGRLDATVEFVHAYGLGFPSGTAEAMERAYRQLADAGVLLIVGPSIGDNALAVTPLAEHLRIPTINSGGADRARGRYMFQHQVGSATDEARLIARHLAALGSRRIGVIHDHSSGAVRQLSALITQTPQFDQAVFAENLSVHADESGVADVAGAVTALLAQEPDAVVYLGHAAMAPQVAEALVQAGANAGWTGPRMLNIAPAHSRDRTIGDSCEGWFHIDRCSNGNRTLQSLLAQTAAKPQQASAAAQGHDLGRLVAEGLARAPELTREGVRAGLERINALPAAQGYEGTLLCFDAQDHGALHGDYLVVRQWLGGQSREIGPPGHVPSAADTIAAGTASRKPLPSSVPEPR